MKRRRLGKRSFAAFLAASMILSASTELVSAKSGSAQNQSSTVSEVSDVSSTAVSSADKSNTSVTIVAESAALNAVKAPTGLQGAGTRSNPYLIGNLDDLLRMNSYINNEKSGEKCFKLTSDVDLSPAYFAELDSKDFAKKSDFTESEGIYSIVSALPSLSGNANVSFHLDGNGFAFKNLNVTVPSGVQAAGLFGYVSASSEIDNVRFENCRFTVKSGSDGAYALIAVQNHGTVRNVTVSDCIVDARQTDADLTSKEYVSLPCGKVCKGISLVVSDNCGSIASVQVKSDDMSHGIFIKDTVQYVGAVAGQNRKTISGSSVSGVRILAYGANDSLTSVSGKGACASYIGMIAGSNDSGEKRSSALIEDCTVTLTHGSDMMYGDYAGGLVGLNAGRISKSAVSGSCAESSDAANLVGAGRFGGLVGLNRGSVESSGAYDVGFAFVKSSSQNVYGGIAAENDGSILKAVASGRVYVNGKRDTVGGIVGQMKSGTVAETYSFVITSSDTDTSGAIFGQDGTVAAVGTSNFWVGSAQGFRSAVPNGGAALNTLQSGCAFVNIPSGNEGMSFTDESLSYSWMGSDAVVSLDFAKSAQSDHASIRVDKGADRFTIRSGESGIYGKVTFVVRVRFPDGVGAGKTVSARVSMPVMVTDSANRGAGSSVDNPIVLSSYNQFKFIRIAPNAHYRMDQDIVLGNDWTPIAFSGTLDGGGHAITVSGKLFSVVSGSRDNAVKSGDWTTNASNTASGVIRNVDIKVNGTVYGGVLGSVDHVTLDHITYSAKGNDDFAVLSSDISGAFVDSVSGNAYIHNCYVSVPITVTVSSSNGIGALVGSVSADVLRMDNCGSSSMIALDGSNLSKVGGLVGYIADVSDGEITNCYASGSVYVKPSVNNVKANIVLGGIAENAKKHLKTDNCYFSVAESKVSGGSVALKAADFASDGIVSLSALQKTYFIDAEGKQETEVVISLPQELDACRDVQASDFSVVLENEDLFISSEPDVSGSDVTIGVMAEEDADTSDSSTLTVIHELTGLKFTDVMSGVNGPDEVYYDSDGDGSPETYYMISELAELVYVYDNWSSYSAANLLLTADIVVDTVNYDGASTDMTASFASIGSSGTGMFGSSSDPFTGSLVAPDIGDTTVEYSSNGDPVTLGADTNGDGKYSIICASFGLSGETAYSDSACAMFPFTDGAVFKNFSLDYIQVNNEGVGTAVLVGVADHGSGNTTSFSDISISNCSVESTFDSGYCNNTITLDTAQVGTLVGGLRGAVSSYGSYSIFNISVSDTTVTASHDAYEVAYGVGGLIGYANCNTDSTVYIGTDGTDSYPIEMDHVTVTGCGSVGGVLGMAGNWPEDADSPIEYGDISGYDNLGSLYIANVTVTGSSTITASDGACGGVLGSEMAGFEEYNSGVVSIADCEVENSTIVSNAAYTDGAQVSAAAACGGIAGYCGGTVSDCTVTDCTIRSATAGGIVGRPARKNYNSFYGSGLKSGTSLKVENCNVLVSNGGTTSITNAVGQNALHLGGIVATTMNTNLTITGCGVGTGVSISGAAQHIGGMIGYVFSYDYPDANNAEDVEKYSVKVLKSVFDGTVQIPSSAQFNDPTAVGGCVGYARIVPGKLCIQYSYFGGSLQNSGYCAGVIGEFSATDPYYYVDTNGDPWIGSCTVTSILNNGTTNSTTTAKLVAGLGDETTDFFYNGSQGDVIEYVCYENMVTSYPQNCLIFGEFSDGYVLTWDYNDPDAVHVNPSILYTYCDINKPDPNDLNDPNATYFNGYSSTSGPNSDGIWVIDHDDSDTVSVPGGDTVYGTGLWNLIKTAQIYSHRMYNDYADLLGSTITWGTSNSSILTVDDTNFNLSDLSNSYLEVTGAANSGDATVYVYGSMDVLYFDVEDYTQPLHPLYMPGTQTPATIRIGAPFKCINYSGGIPWTESNGWWQIPDFAHLNDLQNRITNSSLSHQNYVVTADIDMDGQSFYPIPGTFTGQFKCAEKQGGGYYKIYDWTYTSDSAESVGLFSNASSTAVFTDVCLEGFDLSTTASNSGAGALVGTATGATFNNIQITNCSVSASKYAGLVAAVATDCTASGITLSGGSVGGDNTQFSGGVFGRAVKSNASATSSIQNATVTNVSVTSADSNNEDFAAGIAAEFSGSISTVTVQKTSGNSSIQGSSVAGVVGVTVGITVENTVVGGASITGATVTGLTIHSTDTNSSSAAGGVVAKHDNDVSLTVENSTVDSTISSECYTGGIVGISYCPVNGIVIDGCIVRGSLACSSTSANASTSAVGGLLGSAATTALANNCISNNVVAVLSNSTTHHLTGYGYHGMAVGRIGVNPNAELNITPVSNFYYSSYQLSGVSLCGFASAFTSGSAYDLQTVLQYNPVPADNVGIGKYFSFINYASSTYTVNASAFDLPTGASGTYKQFTAATNVSFTLDTVAFPRGSSLNISTNVLTITSNNGDDVGVFTYTNGVQVTFTVHVSDISGFGSSTSPYLILNPGHLVHLYDSNKSGSYFQIGADLDLSDVNYDFAAIWASDSWRDMTFTGTIIGNKVQMVNGVLENTGAIPTISNLSISGSTRTNTGFFCNFKGTLQNVNFANCSVKSTSTTGNAGTGIVAGCLDSTGRIQNVSVSNSEAEGAKHVGGIAGVSFGTISNCAISSNTTPKKEIKSTAHCAGGIVGGGYNATNCQVTGMTISGYDMAGGIAGGTLSYNVEVSVNVYGQNNTALVDEYILRGKTMSFDDSQVSNTSIATGSNNATSYAGGILGIAENGEGSNYRAVSFKNCKVNSTTTVTANAKGATLDENNQTVYYPGQTNYAGGIVGYLDEYYDGFVIENSEVYALVTSNGCAGSNDKTSAGGLLGATNTSDTVKLRSAANADLAFYMNFNVVNCEVKSAKYAGGVAGCFMTGTDPNLTDTRLTSTDSFICKNILAPKFENIESVDGSAFSYSVANIGVFAGLFKPSAMARVFPDGVTAVNVMNLNYFSSDVSCSDVNAGIERFGGSTDNDALHDCGMIDVAKTLNNNVAIGSFRVDNDNDGSFADDGDDTVNGTRDKGTYLMPVQLLVQNSAGQNVDLGTAGAKVSVAYGNYSSRDLTIDSSQNTAAGIRKYASPISLIPSDSWSRDFYSSTYTVHQTNGVDDYYCSEFKIGDNAANCQEDTKLVADLGYGLQVYIGVATATGLGIQGNPYKISSEEKFVKYFFSKWAKTSSNDYLNRYYEQTADLNFDVIKTEITKLTTTEPGGLARSYTFSPIGTSTSQFNGSYDGGGHRIVGFEYNGTDANIGLFGYVGSTGRLCDIHLELTDKGVTGGTKTTVSGKDVWTLTGSSNIGGLVGYYAGANPIVNCSVLYGQVRGGKTSQGYAVRVGGLVGATSGMTLRYCFTSTDVRVADETVAAAGTQRFDYSAGGLIGHIETGGVTLDRCFTSSDIVGQMHIGAFTGSILQNNNNEITIRNCFSTASVTSLRHLVQDSAGSNVITNEPVSLVTGYKYGVNPGGSTTIDYTFLQDPYVSAQNLYVAGTNASEFINSTTSSFYSVSLFGFCAAKSDSANVFYDAQVIGRLTFTATGGSTGYIKVNGSLFSSSNTPITNSAISAMCKKTADLTDIEFSSFADIGSVTVENTWNSGYANLYPVLKMSDSKGFSDLYSQAVAKMSAMPIFLDPREADDETVTSERVYTGVTYPVSIAKTLDGAALSMAASAYSEASGDTYYPPDYDEKLSGATIGNRTWDSANGNVLSITQNARKNADFLFKGARSEDTNATEVTVLRNSYLDYGSIKTDIPRDQKTPCVYVWGAIDGDDNTETDNSVMVCRAIRIPLRGESNTVYVATERQLRAIMGWSSEASNKFRSAYQYVTYKDSIHTGKNVLICADIELNPLVPFTPITDYKYNVGSSTEIGFDGGNCEISNMVFANSGDHVGMFDHLDGPGIRVQNIILRDVQISGGSYVGALAGEVTGRGTVGANTNCVIVNCMVKTTEGNTTAGVSGSGSFIGGLVGKASSTMINCVENSSGIPYTPMYTNATYGIARNKVTGADVPVSGVNYVGGLIGEMVKVGAANCFASGDVTYSGTGSSVEDTTDYTRTGNSARLSYGGFAGNIINDSKITYCFASGNVDVSLPTVNNNLGGEIYVGIGGFAGTSTIAIENCFSMGDVDSDAAGYDFSNTQTETTVQGVGGLVGYTVAPVTNSYSTSAVTSQNASVSGVTIGVGGVVGYSGSNSGSDINSVYSSGSVTVTSVTTASSAGSSMNIGGAAGYVYGTAQKAYFDLWTNHIVGLNAVGNISDDTDLYEHPTNYLGYFNTEEFCDGSLVTGGYLSSSTWGYDPYLARNDSSYRSNTYPYLKIFFDAEHSVSKYVRFPAALSVVAVRPNDRDESARNGEGYTMAVTIPEYVQVSGPDVVIDNDTYTTRVQYYLASGAVGSNVVQYGKTVYAPQRIQNDEETVRLLIWVNKYNVVTERENTVQSEVMHTGYFEQTNDRPAADNNVEQITAATLERIRLDAKETYEPRIGQYVKMSEGYKEYGVRSVRRVFRLMLGTTEYPYLITSADELAAIFTVNNYQVSSSSTYKNLWFSQQQFNSSLGKYVNVVKNTNPAQNPDDDSVVHFRLMINIDMDGKTFTPIGSMYNSGTPFSFTSATGMTIAFQGYELDGNDYAIVNFTSQNPFIDTLDATSSVKNLIFSGVTLGGINASNDLALIKTNNGEIDGLMLMQADTDDNNGVNDDSTVQTSGSAAGLVVTNNGTIKQSIAQGTITGGAASKYVGGIAAENNGTIEYCVSAADLTANSGTEGIGGLVGLNNASKTIKESFSLGSVTAAGNTFAGGAVGVNNGSVKYAYTRTAVSGATVGKTGSFVGKNAGSIENSFSAGKMSVSGATANSVGSAFVGTTDGGTLTKAFADKALLGKDTYMLLGDAQVTENIIDLSCFDVYTALDSPSGSIEGTVYEYTNNAYVQTSDTAYQSGTTYYKRVYTSTTGGYPQLAGVLALNEAQSYTIGGVTGSYTMLKVRLLKAYSALAAFTTDTPYGNYIDAIPAAAIPAGGLPMTDLASVVTIDANDRTITGSYALKMGQTAKTSIESTDTTGNITATTPTFMQKIGAGTNTIDDLKYQLSFGVDFEVKASSNTAPNPNFPAGGIGSSTASYVIGTNSTYSAENSFGSLTYFGKATEPAYFTMATDVSYNGDGTYEVSETTYHYSIKDYPIEEFCGILNGAGYTVNDLTLTRGGLLGSLKNGATVQNLGLVGINLNVTPTATASNYGLLANEAIGTNESHAAVTNVYAVGELKVANVSGVVTNVGGLIGYTENAVVSHVVTSGYIRNNSTVEVTENSVTKASTVGGVIGAMNGGSLDNAESTAYVYGEKIIGGIVGKETGSTTISDVIFAGMAADTYMTNGDVTDSDHRKDGTGAWVGNDNWNDATLGDPATISHIVADSDGGAPSGTVKYDKQLALFEENDSWASTTSDLAQLSSSGLFTAVDDSKYYTRPAGLVFSPQSDAFKAGLGFATALINVSLALSDGDVFGYDEIYVASPVNKTADTVALTEDRVIHYSNDGSHFMTYPQTSTTKLTPKGGADGYTGVKATLSNGENASFDDNVNVIYRYFDANIVRVVYVAYVIDDSACDASHKLGNDTKVMLMLHPSLHKQVSANAVTSINEDSDATNGDHTPNTVCFRQFVTSGSGKIGVQAVLPNGYKYTVSTTTSGATATNGATVNDKSVSANNSVNDENNPLNITVNVDEADPTWGLQYQNGTMTPVQ